MTRGPLPGATNAGRPRKRTPEQSAKVGTARKRSQPSRAVAATVVDTSTVPVPAQLEANGGAVVFRELAGASWISPIDREMVTQLAETIDEREKYRAALAEHGPLLIEPIVTPKGDVVGTRLVPNPAEGMLRRCEARIERLARDLGLTPTARARLGLVIANATATADAVMRGRRKAAS